MPLVHTEIGDVVAERQARLMAAGNDGLEAHAYSRPLEVEGEAANRAIMIADMAGVPLYVVHVSCEQARMMASTLSHSVSSMAHLLSANLSRNPRCLRAEASIFANAYKYGMTVRRSEERR